jgi:hypothetical protein
MKPSRSEDRKRSNRDISKGIYKCWYAFGPKGRCKWGERCRFIHPYDAPHLIENSIFIKGVENDGYRYTGYDLPSFMSDDHRHEPSSSRSESSSSRSESSSSRSESSSSRSESSSSRSESSSSRSESSSMRSEKRVKKAHHSSTSPVTREGMDRELAQAASMKPDIDTTLATIPVPVLDALNTESKQDAIDFLSSLSTAAQVPVDPVSISAAGILAATVRFNVDSQIVPEHHRQNKRCGYGSKCSTIITCQNWHESVDIHVATEIEYATCYLKHVLQPAVNNPLHEVLVSAMFSALEEKATQLRRTVIAELRNEPLTNPYVKLVEVVSRES